MPKKPFILFFAISALLGFAGLVFASGNISGYAWSSNAGWINFGTTNGNATVSDSAMSGYIWNESYGWINLAPSNSGVANTTSGILSGYAWGENLGWINFSGVVIDCSGNFTGTASGDSAGTINFDCENCNVLTTWSRTSGCGGGGGAPVVPDPVYHTECANQRCVQVEGVGTNSCSTDNDCATHNECNASHQCVSVPGIGLSQCNTSSDCAVKHNECNSSEQCVQVDGEGENQCTVSQDCVIPKHYECDGQKRCVVVEGSGNDICLADADCNITHKECDAQLKCVAVDGVGVDQCSADLNCQPQRHNECNAQKQCVPVDGSGFDSCQTDADCDQFHYECVYRSCVKIDGSGASQCSSDSDCYIPKHNICNSEKQCVSVDGAGSDACQTSVDCESAPFCGDNNCGNGENCSSCRQDCGECVIVPPAGIEVPPSVGEIPVIGNVVVEATEQINKVIEESAKVLNNLANTPQGKQVVKSAGDVKKAVETPVGSAVTKTVSTVGVTAVAVASVSTAVFNPASVFELFLLPFRLISLLLAVFGIKKRSTPWGTVYDSVTKQPIDPVYLDLKDLLGNKIASAVTDMDGRFGFFAGPGVYRIFAGKTNYIFPSKKLFGNTEDEIYSHLYFGEEIQIKKPEDVIAKNIPMDPVKFDWNEFAKKDKKLLVFYSKWDFILRRMIDIFFAIGFVVALVAFFSAPYPYNTVIAVLYLLMLALRFFGVKPKAMGLVAEKNTGHPLSFAILRVFLPGSNIEIAHKIADKYGRYYCLVPKGKYYVKVEKKNPDGTYEPVYTSGEIGALKNGIIKERFQV